MSQTVTRDSLAADISARLDISKRQARRFVDKMFDLMVEGLQGEGSLKLTGFGSFEVVERKSRVGRNPNTGERIVLPPRKAVRFKPSSRLRGALSNATGREPDPA